MSPHRTQSPSTGNLIPDLTHVSDPSNPTSPSIAADSVYSQAQFSESSDVTSLSSVDDVLHSRPLIPGVYVPTVTFFHPETEDLDLPTISKHAVRLAKAGVAGIATQGSNGEAVHLSRSERKQVTRTTRKALTEGGFDSMPIIVGCGAQSTREAIELCHEASAAGGDYALILPPSYYKAMFTPDSLIEFFNDVADASPIPILIYNYPAAVGGIDLSSDVISTLAKHANIAGCKLTCGNTGKLARIAAATDAASTTSNGSGFMCLGGSADFTLQTLVVGGSGVICGVGNVAPKACARIVDLYAAGKLQEARKLQAVVARGDWAAITGGIIGTKSGLETYYGYGGHARKPLPRVGKEQAAKYADAFKEIVELENSLD